MSQPRIPVPHFHIPDGGVKLYKGDETRNYALQWAGYITFRVEPQLCFDSAVVWLKLSLKLAVGNI